MPPQNTNVAVSEKKPTLSMILAEDRFKSRFNQVLGARANQFISSLIQVAGTMEDVEPMSIIAAGMTAATLDLPINKSLGYAWIIPYATGFGKDRKKLAQFQIGAKGFIQLALRSNQYRHLNVCTVYEGELVKHDKMRAIVEIDSAKKTSDTIIGYCGFLMLLSGYEHAEYWTAAEVDAHANEYSKALQYAIKDNKTDSLWQTDREGMSHKTVISLLIRKWGIMSVDMQRAVRHDHGAQIDVDAEVTYVDNQPAVKQGLIPEGPGGSSPEEPTTFDKPSDEFAARLKRDSVTEPQVLKVLKDMSLAGPDTQEVFQLSDAKINQVLAAWPSLLPQFKAAKV